MENKEALDFLYTKSSIRAATEEFISEFNLPQCEFHTIRRKFGELKSDKDFFVKKNDLATWEQMFFYAISYEHPPKRRSSSDKVIFEADISSIARKPLSELTTKGLRVRLSSLLKLVDQLAEKEQVDSKTIATYCLQLVSNLTHDIKTSSFCKEIISTGKFGDANNILSIEKSTFLLDQLEIGKQKYTDLKRLLKANSFFLPPYKLVALHRAEITLANDLQYVSNSNQITIGIYASYRMMLKQTVVRLLSTLPQLNNDQFPLALRISDGLDGSGSHQIYNQLQESIQFNSKNFLLFAFKILSIKDSSDCDIWVNTLPNSHFQLRPVALIAMKESEENVRFLMESYINPETKMIEQEGIVLPQGLMNVKIYRSMFDGKMSGILTGAGGAKCQLCTATFEELHDIDLVRSGFPINRTISAARDIFASVDKSEYLALPSKERFGLTHEPLSEIETIPASPLHSYTCVFRWFMTLVYHLHSGSTKWSPTSAKVRNSLKFVREFLREKTGLKIDQPSSDGGTTSTGNIARECFNNKNNIIHWISTLITADLRDPITKILHNLSAILRSFSSSREINTDTHELLCRETYEFILLKFPFANITPSLHKLLAHSTELIRDCNNGFGMKEFSEEAVESCNKLIRKYREHLSRKNSFSLNTKDIFVRLSSQSDPVLITFRHHVVCKTCGELNHICKINCKTSISQTEQDELFNSLLI